MSFFFITIATTTTTTTITVVIIIIITVITVHWELDMFQMQFFHLSVRNPWAVSAPPFIKTKQWSIPDILPCSFEYHCTIVCYSLLTIILQNFHDIFDLSFCILRLHSENVLNLSSFFSFIILIMSNILIHVKAKIWPLHCRLSIQLALDILLV